MPCTISSYGGVFGQALRKYLPRVASEGYLHLQYLLRRQDTGKYIRYFSQSALPPHPLLVSIETINRCNSTCSFCPANCRDEKRPFAQMDEALFKKIIGQLHDADYRGYLSLYVNNEPLMDRRIYDFYAYARAQLPHASMLMFTNGTLLDIDKFKLLAPNIDIMTINNYSSDFKIHKNLLELFRYIKERPGQFDSIDVNIQQRYLGEVLTNRAGVSPNKQAGRKPVREKCLMPFTDLTVYPDGTVGLCCCDALEKTNLGNLQEQSFLEIWNGPKYREIRSKVSDGRDGYPFCRTCDFVDAGIRIEKIKQVLR